MTSADDRHLKDFDAGTWTAIVGGIFAGLTAIVSGFWQWFSGRKKSEQDAQQTAQTAALTGLGSLIAYSQAHIERLEKRVVELENDLQKCGQRILVLERQLIRHGVDVPNGG